MGAVEVLQALVGAKSGIDGYPLHFEKGVCGKERSDAWCPRCTHSL